MQEERQPFFMHHQKTLQVDTADNIAHMKSLPSLPGKNRMKRANHLQHQTVMMRVGLLLIECSN